MVIGYDKMVPAAVWSVYLIRTRQGALYTGITTDVERRFVEHQQGTVGAKYLRSKGPLTLVYQRELGNRSLASRVEYAIKQLTKVKKEEIVATQLDNPQLLTFLDLAEI